MIRSIHLIIDFNLISLPAIIAAELLKLVERAVLDPKKEGKLWLREGKFDWYSFKNGYINSGLLVTTKKIRKKEKEKVTGILANPKYNFLGIILKSQKGGQVSRKRGQKGGLGGRPPPPQKRGQFDIIYAEQLASKILSLKILGWQSTSSSDF